MFYFLVAHVIRYRKKVIDNNLKNSFPDKTIQERNKIRRDFYHHLCDIFFETYKLLHISDEQMKKRCKFNNPHFADKFFEDGKGVVAIMGHYGNWEWISALPLWNDKFTFLPIYKPLHNKVLDKMYIEIRSKLGCKPLAKKDVLRTMMRHKVDSNPTLTGFIGDQTPTPRNIHYWTNFLNQDTPIFIGVEKIARKFNQPVYYTKMTKIKRGYYEVDVELITENPKEMSEFEITEIHSRILEKDIIANPAYWLWSHKRWKHSR
jgi:KDO2-lipid IV(A) lauroyltransferase